MEKQNTLPGMGKKELLKSMSREELVDYIRSLGDKIAELEKHMSSANEVLGGVYGLTIDQAITEIERNEKQ